MDRVVGVGDRQLRRVRDRRARRRGPHWPGQVAVAGVPGWEVVVRVLAQRAPLLQRAART